MANLITTFQSQLGDWGIALVQHVQLSLLALLLAVLISVPLGILLSKYQNWAEASLQVTGVFQTIPSLALLGLFIPIMGIGAMPAVVALVVYAIFPIMQSTVTALASIDPSLVEAGKAFGMNRWERLKTFMLPIGMPILMSGIRTAAVMIIGTATLASLIGAGGLGSFIMLGIDRNNSDLILIGAVSSALLAMVFNFILKILEKARLRTVVLSFAIMFMGLLMTYAPNVIKQTKESRDKIVIAGKLGAEPEILINLYRELIEADTNLTVELKPNFGKTSFLYEALKSGDIDIYPEFTGTVTGSLLKEHPKLSNDPKEVYLAARDGLLKQDDLVLLKPMAYQNTYALAVTKAFAKEHQLHEISDLKRIPKELVAGFSLEFSDRPDGYSGLQETYGLKVKVNTMEPALRYQAITTGDVTIIDAYSTDSQLRANRLVTLKDDKQLFPPYQGAPLMTATLLKTHPELAKSLNKLAGKITEKQMTAMNYQVDVKGKSAAEVAHNYLLAEGLLDD